MNTINMFTVCFLLLFFLLVSGCLPEGKKQHWSLSQTPLQLCPDILIHNAMPGTSTKKPRSYYVLAGKRYEIEEFDTHWIEKNCTLREETVY